MPVDKDEVVQLYEGGLNQPDIAERFNLTQSRISQILSQKGVKTRKFTKWWSDEEVKILKEYYPPDSTEEKQLLKEKLCVEGRDWESITSKAQKIGVSRCKQDYLNSQENREILSRNTQKRTINVDFGRDIVGYIVGVLDSDGYTNNKRNLGLDVRDKIFVDKFKTKLEELGLNPNIFYSSEDRYKLTAASTEFIDWYENQLDRQNMNIDQKKKYIEGLYEGDGTLHKSGGPMICSTDDEFKEFLLDFMSDMGFNCSIQQSGVWVSTKDRAKFFELIDPVIKGPDYYSDDR